VWHLSKARGVSGPGGVRKTRRLSKGDDIAIKDPLRKKGGGSTPRGKKEAMLPTWKAENPWEKGVKRKSSN